MNIDARLVKSLRDKTEQYDGLQRALLESDGDIENAIDYLRKSGITKAEKKGSRETRESYTLTFTQVDGQVLIELNCETDFVAKTEGFKELAHNISMQIAAANPIAIDKDLVDKDDIQRKRNLSLMRQSQRENQIIL